MAALGEATETPERLWTPAMRATTAEELAHLAAQAHTAQVIVTLLHLHLIWPLELLGGSVSSPSACVLSHPGCPGSHCSGHRPFSPLGGLATRASGQLRLFVFCMIFSKQVRTYDTAS